MDVKQFQSQIQQFVEEVFNSIKKALADSLSPDNYKDLIENKSNIIVESIFNNITKSIENKVGEINIGELLTHTYENTLKEIEKFQIQLDNEKDKKIKLMPPRFINQRETFQTIKKNIDSIKNLSSHYDSSTKQIISNITEGDVDKSSMIKETQNVITSINPVDTFDDSVNKQIETVTNIIKNDKEEDDSAINVIAVPVIETRFVDRKTLIRRFKSFNKLTESKINLLNIKTKGLREKSKYFSNLFLDKIKLIGKWVDITKNSFTKPNWLMSMIEVKFKLKIAEYVKNFLSKTKLGSSIFRKIRYFKLRLFRKIKKNSIAKALLKFRERIKLFKLNTSKKIIDIVKSIKPIKFIIDKIAKLKSLKISNISKLLVSKPLKFLLDRIKTMGGFIGKLIIGKSGILSALGKVFGKAARFGVKSLPGIGALFDAWFAYKSFKNGDPVKAAIYGLNGFLKLAAAVPVLTPFLMPISFAIDLGLLASDFTDVNFTKFLMKAGKPIIDVIKFIIDGRLWDATKKLLSSSYNQVKSSFLWLKDQAISAGKVIWDETKRFASLTAKTISRGWDWWSKQVVSAKEWSIKQAEKGWEWMKEKTGSAYEFMSTMWKSAQSYVKDNFEQIYNLMEKIPSFIKRFIEFKNKLKVSINDYLDNKIKIIMERYRSSVDSFKNFNKETIYVLKNYKNIQIDDNSINPPMLNDIKPQNIITSAIDGNGSMDILNYRKTKQQEEFIETKKIFDMQTMNPEGLNTVEKIVQTRKLQVPETFKIEMERIRAQLLYLRKSLNT